MKEKVLRGTSFLCLIALLLISTQQTHARSRLTAARDHLTPQEADLVREAQELDKRTLVFIKAAERRLLALTNPSAANQKDADKLGELKGTRADFLYDLSKILDEAITNIDDVSSRDERNPLVPKSLRKLAETSSRIIAQLTPMREQLDDESRERATLETAIENAQAVLEAAGKLPPPAPAKNSKKKKEDKQ